MKVINYECNTSHELDKVLNWCEQQYGTCGSVDFNRRWVWDVDYSMMSKPYSINIQFWHNEDAALFVLKWK